jgi:hypothetical protein
MNVKRFVIAGIVVSVLFLVLDGLLGVAGGFVGELVFGLSAGQPDESRMLLSPVFELINGFMLVAVYAVINDGLPGRGWKKGIGYGLIVWGLRVVMWAFSTYIMTDMSPILIGISVVTGLVEVLILCIVTAAICR